jgi:hypothetical protein
MPNKTFPVRLEVEEIALGTVLRKLNDMPGIAKLHLDLGHGGEGAGKQQLESAAALQGTKITDLAMRILAHGQPMHVRQISSQLGGARTRTYSALTQLRKAGLVKNGGASGTHQLTAAAMAQVSGGGRALPAPKIKRGPAGRAAPGTGPALLQSALRGGPKPTAVIIEELAAHGMSAKGVHGVILRGQKAGFVKRTGKGQYALTAKGEKQEQVAAGANGHG